MSEFLNDDQKEFLLDLARDAVAAKVRDDRTIPAQTDDPILLSKRGVFVTLKVNGELAGFARYERMEPPAYPNIPFRAWWYGRTDR